jgi:hypothetical protein
MEIVCSRVCLLPLIIPSLRCVEYWLRIAQISFWLGRLDNLDMLTSVGSFNNC